MKEKEKRKRRITEIVRCFFLDIGRTLIYFVVIGVVTVLIVRFVGQRTIVEGSSMEPTLSNGDNLIVDKLSYHFHKPERFDVIVFPDAEEKNKLYVKRIIGLPGETVQIDENGYIYINGEHLEEAFGLEVIRDAGRAKEGITLGKDEYFVMGDNRNDSLDSRTEKVGNVHRNIIIGRAMFRIYPLSKLGAIRHG